MADDAVDFMTEKVRIKRIINSYFINDIFD